MNKQEIINKVLNIASSEVGYLEKNNNNNLYDKSANAGSGNYTKYWAEIKPSYQGQPWCACFVTWVFVQAFGREAAEKLLKHYPYVYCPTMASLFSLKSNPDSGDIVVFYRNGSFAHTGLVTSVHGDYFTTVEGNTSGGSTIIPNGGGVCAKSYYNSKLPGTKFVSVDWSIVSTETEDNMTTAEKAEFQVLRDDCNKLIKTVDELSAQLADKNKVYDWIKDMPDWAKPTIEKLYNVGKLQGDENGALGLSYDLMRALVILNR